MAQIGCEVCGTRPVLAVLHDPETGARRGLCAAHAGFALVPEDDAPVWEARLAAGADDAETLYGAACARLRAGRAAEAIALLERLAAREPDCPVVRERLADALERAGRLEEALAVQRALLEHEPDRGESHARLARLLALAGDMDAALASYERGARRDPAAFVCVERAAILRLARGEPEIAVRGLRRYLGIEAIGQENERRHDEAVVRRARREARGRAHPVDARRLPLTARDHAGPLALERALRRVEGRRDYEVAASRFRAWGLLAAAYRAAGDPERERWARAQAIEELDGIPDVLLAEVQDRLGPEADRVRAIVRQRAHERSGDGLGG